MMIKLPEPGNSIGDEHHELPTMCKFGPRAWRRSLKPLIILQDHIAATSLGLWVHIQPSYLTDENMPGGS